MNTISNGKERVTRPDGMKSGIDDKNGQRRNSSRCFPSSPSPAISIVSSHCLSHTSLFLFSFYGFTCWSDRDTVMIPVVQKVKTLDVREIRL